MESSFAQVATGPLHRRRLQWYSRIHGLLLLALTLGHIAVLVYTSTKCSPTMQEPAFVAAGLCHWKWERYDVYSVNPPLVKMVAALPAIILGFEGDWRHLNVPTASRPEFILGADFVKANQSRALDLITYARWCCLPFSLVGLFCAYIWSRRLYGPAGGLITFALLAYEPTLLAHAGLATCDTACHSLGLIAAYTFWLWNREPNWPRTVAAGVAFGAAQLAKLTWISLYVLWPVLWVAYRFACNRNRSFSPIRAERGSVSRETSQLGAILFLGLYITNVGYGFSGSFRPLGEATFVSSSFSGSAGDSCGNRFRGNFLSGLPVPLPSDYLAGIDLQARDFERYHHPSYLRKEWKNGGWWWYYIYCCVVKLPLSLWVLFSILGVLSLGRRGRTAERSGEMFLVVPALVVFVLVSSQTEFNHHFRYVLPAIAFSLVIFGRLGAVFSTAGSAPLRVCIAGIVACAVAGTLRSVPCQLSYFNALVGGPENGSRHLGGSNLDWGQDLLILRDWVLAEHPGSPILAVFDAPFDPKAIGLDATMLSPGWESAWEPNGSRPLVVVNRCLLFMNNDANLDVGANTCWSEWRRSRAVLLRDYSEIWSPSFCYSVWRHNG